MGGRLHFKENRFELKDVELNSECDGAMQNLKKLTRFLLKTGVRGKTGRWSYIAPSGIRAK